MSYINSKISLTPVILCGGSGTRLWPLSRTGFPKQFLVLSGKTSLFQQAVERLNTLGSEDILLGETLIVTGEEHRFLVLDQLRELPNVNAKLLLEPEGKNTAPALTLAALQALKNGDDPVLLVTPADQIIQNLKSFTEALQKSIMVAADKGIVVLGIKPNSPETGFGYIKYKGSSGTFGEFEVDQFVEKPDLVKANEYLEVKSFAWNSGIFLLRASTWLKALDQFRPDIKTTTEKAFLSAMQDSLFIRPEAELFKSIPNESIDFAVIEKCPGSAFPIKMMPLDVGWSDLGSWSAVWQAGLKDHNQNLIYGDVLTNNTSHSLIYANHRLISVVGLDNIAVIETADVVLVADLNQSQHVKKIVDALAMQNREERLLHRRVSRPWGWYDTIDSGERFKVKRIQINPKASLSLQKHLYRAEHWVVIKGEAEIINGNSLIRLIKNQSAYIPPSGLHRLANPTDQPLEIIEVQTGDYLGEDDIERFDDDYGRL
jgi:mannose-1-phosphate guanylyltransferase/mannose-6-phosphate isomerase